MSDINWDAVPESTIPTGTFIGWGRVGQVVMGTVLSYSSDAGSDFNGEHCPLLVVELVTDTENYRDKGTTKEGIDAGELASVTAAQANLARHLRSLEPRPGDVIRVEYASEYKTARGIGKEFKVQVVRGAAVKPSIDPSSVV